MRLNLYIRRRNTVDEFICLYPGHPIYGVKLVNQSYKNC